MIQRIYVEKQRSYATAEVNLLSDIQSTLKIQNLQGIRIVHRYDVEGLSSEAYEDALHGVFGEPAVDRIYRELLPEDFPSQRLAVEYLPGQYDMRAESAIQCIRLAHPREEIQVRYATVYGFQGNLTSEQKKRMEEYLINPVDSRRAREEKPESLTPDVISPPPVEPLSGFCRVLKEQRQEWIDRWGFSMDVDDFQHIQEYFREEEGRDPTITEMKVLDTYWSDHCRHTTFHTNLSQCSFEDSDYGRMVQEAMAEYLEMRQEVYGHREKPVTLMDMASIGTKYLKKRGLAHDLDESEEVNACSIKRKVQVDGQPEDWLIQFKNETHNHPTEIEPYGGAATCLGGAIRDPLAGRAYIYQAMRVTGSGDPRRPLSETLPGKLPQKKITREAALGYSSYGNQIGVATGLVDEIYHEGYVAKRMEVGAVIGATPQSHVIRKRPEPGDLVLLLGGKTGRDGCGGATGSSKKHTQNSMEEGGAEVQKGNPPVERDLQRLFRQKKVARCIKRCNDFGAGGVSVAVGELAPSLFIDLDTIPKKYEGLDGTELAISESQERMAIVIDPKNREKIIHWAAEENVEATVIGSVTDTGRMIMVWQGQEIFNIQREFLETNGREKKARVQVVQPDKSASKHSDQVGEKDQTQSLRQDMEKILEDLNVASKKGLAQQFDSTIGAATVLMPYGGRFQRSPEMGMVAKVPLQEGETTTATAMTYGGDPHFMEKNPFLGAVFAVVDSVTKMVALGANMKESRLSFQEYFKKLVHEADWGEPMAALLGGVKAQKELGIPSIGGKDSMSGTFQDLSVPPTLLSFAVNTLEVDRVLSVPWKGIDHSLIYLPCTKDSRGLPRWEVYRKTMEQVEVANKAGAIQAACALGRGGLFAALVKMAVGNEIGAQITIPRDRDFFEKDYGGLLLEMNTQADIPGLFSGTEFYELGKTQRQKVLVVQTLHGQKEEISLEEIIRRWESPLEGIFPQRLAEKEPSVSKMGRKKDEIVNPAQNTDARVTKPAVSGACPRVVIPVFPGTNCEVDSLRAFEKAGAKGQTLLIRHRRKEDLEESIRDLAKAIKESQILMIPGGFSGGDEPDGAAKFIAAIFRHPRVEEAVGHLMNQRDGLILGICNGFQGLIKLGLLPYGEIRPGTQVGPALTYNTIGRHQSGLVQTRVASTMSPWLWGIEEGTVYQVPVSHGEGRFFCDSALAAKLNRNGQIATQYVDLEGTPTMDIDYNPNQSLLAIEGITSPDGRIFGKMGHVERVTSDLYRNVPSGGDMALFRRGVNYFK